MKYLILGLCLLIIIIYVILIPLTKRKNVKNAQSSLEDFYKELKIDDKIVLADGIIGVITEKKTDIYKVKISNNVEVEVNKFGIVSKASNLQ